MSEKPMPPIETPPTEARSRVMRAIRSKDTAPELALVVALAEAGAPEFERHCADLPGRPDFAFRRKMLAVFVDSAFWHGRAGVPKTNSAWWAEKLRRNMEHDLVANRALEIMGWTWMRLDAAEVLRDAAGFARGILEELEAK